MYIGTVIKKLRIDKQLTQQELACGFRSIKQISRIENNDSLPSLEMLYYLMTRLGYELYDYMPYNDDPNVYEIKAELDTLKSHYSNRNFNMVLSVLQKSLFANKTKSRIANLEYSWLYNASLYQLDRSDEIDCNLLYQCIDQNLCKHTLLSAFDKPRLVIEHKILLIIIALLDTNTDNQLQNKAYAKGIDNFERYYANIKERSFLVYCHNLALKMLDEQNFDSVITYCEKGIANCTHNHTLYLLDQFYYIMSRAHNLLGNADLSNQLLYTAVVIEQLTDKNNGLNFTINHCWFEEQQKDLDCRFCKTVYGPNKDYDAHDFIL